MLEELFLLRPVRKFLMLKKENIPIKSGLKLNEMLLPKE